MSGFASPSAASKKLLTPTPRRPMPAPAATASAAAAARSVACSPAPLLMHSRCGIAPKGVVEALVNCPRARLHRHRGMHEAHLVSSYLDSEDQAQQAYRHVVGACHRHRQTFRTGRPKYLLLVGRVRGEGWVGLAAGGVGTRWSESVHPSQTAGIVRCALCDVRCASASQIA